MLIYRYFGGLDGLVSAVAKSPELFISIEEICAGDIAAMLALPLPERAAAVARNYARALIERPVVLAMMAWETVERNKLTAIVETAREEMSTRIADMLFPEIATQPEIAGAMALIGAAINYLAMRQRKIRIYSGVNIRTDQGWQLLVDEIQFMMKSFAVTSGERLHFKVDGHEIVIGDAPLQNPRPRRHHRRGPCDWTQASDCQPIKFRPPCSRYQS